MSRPLDPRPAAGEPPGPSGPPVPAGSATPPAALEGLVRGLHHVAIAVPGLDAARAVYVDALGLAPGEVEHVPDQKVNVLVLHAGAQRIELVEPAAEDSPISRFLERKGGGLHHLAWRVDDVAAALRALAARGVRLIDDAPRPGSHGTRIAFVHPKSTGGVLMELVEDPAHPTGAPVAPETQDA